jgi:general secretion pathway protein D
MKLRFLPALLAISIASTPSLAQEAASQDPADEQRGTDIHALIEKLSEEMDREFIVDPRLPSGERMGYTTREDANYESLLAILRLNGFAAIERGNQILIVPEQNMRSEPLRILADDDSRVSDHEIVTRLIHITPVMGVVGYTDDGQPIERPTPQATNLVPVLRPMMPQSAQLGAIPGTNTLVIVDRYDNVRRITAIVNELLGSLDD